MLTNIDEFELKEILRLTPSEQNIMIAGKHGIGKSKIVENYFTSIGKKVVTFFCSQAADPGDIIGLPRYNDVTKKTEFALPWWFPTDGQPVVLFLDELNRARPEILQVVMDLTLNRKLAGKKLPAGSQIISAINIGDEYQLTDLDPALVSRFNVYNFAPTANDWIKWANANKVDTRVVSFISTNVKYLDSSFKEDSTTLDKSPDRRAWERISDIVKPLQSITTSDLALKKMICGIVGSAAGVAFFDSIVKNTLITPKDILTNFASCMNGLSRYTLQEYAALNDNICSYIDSSLGDFGDDEVTEDLYAKNLNEYFNHLTDKKSGNKEAFAHFINDYETGQFPKLNYIIASHPNTLETSINNFLTRTKTV